MGRTHRIPEQHSSLQFGVDFDPWLRVHSSRNRRSRRQRRFAWLAIMAIGLLGFGATEAFGTPQGETQKRSGAPHGATLDPTGVPVTFELLAATDASGPPGAHALNNPQIIASRLEQVNGSPAHVGIDLRNWVVLSMTTRVKSCKDVLVALHRQGDILVPEFGRPPEKQGQPVLCPVGPTPGSFTREFLIAIDRAAVSPTSVLQLPLLSVDDPHEFPLALLAPPFPPVEGPTGVTREPEVFTIHRAPARRIGEVEVQATQESFSHRWMELGLGAPESVPTPRFGTQVVVIFTIPSAGTCPPVIRGVGGTTQTPTFYWSYGDHDRAESECGPYITAHTIVVAADRPQAGQAISATVPGDAFLGIAEAQTTFVVP